MEIPKSELYSVLQEFNPWWRSQPQADLPDWERSASSQIWTWIQDRETHRALLLTGARQVGKTTLLRQCIRRLIQENYPESAILYVTFDHPILKLAGLERTLLAWEELFPPNREIPRFLFLDEIQYVPHWQTWLKHHVDFKRGDRIAVTGSASPLREATVESGVGRIETIPFSTLSFMEYLRLRTVETPNIPTSQSLLELFDWHESDFARIAVEAQPLTPHFHEYLLRGGFPEPAMTTDLVRCQRLLREDIVDKVLKRDMTALYGVRRVLDVERIFLYLCYHDGGILDIQSLTQSLEGVNRQSAQNFLDLFEATHLIYRLKPYGYGKEVLRGRDKIYLADAALPGAVTLMGRRLLERPDRLGAAVETTFFKHALTRYYRNTPIFSYWRNRKSSELEVDLIAEMGDRIAPFEVKYQDAAFSQNRIKGLRLFLEQRELKHGYVITRRWEDFGVHRAYSAQPRMKKELLDAYILAIPAPLACYWLSA